MIFQYESTIIIDALLASFILIISSKHDSSKV